MLHYDSRKNWQSVTEHHRLNDTMMSLDKNHLATDS
jgi:hypothetical protein